MKRLWVLALLWGCGSGSTLPFEPAGPTAAPDPGLRGPFAVGVRTLTIEDPTRTENGAPRKLVTEVWYPAVAPERAENERLAVVGATYDIRSQLNAEQLAK